MINGAHMIVFGDDADAARTFFRDTLGMRSEDAGGGWLIFALPPAEVAFHPGGESHELYLMCDDVNATREELEGKGVEFTEPVSEQGFGLMTRFKVPGAGQLGLYQPKHPTPLDL
jgi:catechol 2,3-dioxygenase-like lactoylglutathione lyase family enzyme